MAATSDNDKADDASEDVNIEVKFSDPEEALNAHSASRPEGDPETDLEDEDDVELDASTARTARTPAVAEDVTPATSRPTEPSKSVRTIQETPARSSAHGEEHPFSTASKQSLANAAAAALSPLASKGDSQAPASTLVDEMEDSGSSEVVGLKLTPAKRNRAKYGKRNRGTRSEAQATSDAEADGGFPEGEKLAGEEVEGEEIAVAQSDMRDNVPTSEAMHTSQAADEAASRSMQPKGTKRKLPVAASNDGDDVTSPAQKRSKRVKDSDDPMSSTADEAPAPPPPAPPQKRSKTTQPSRKKSVESVEEEIVVASTASGDTHGEASLSPQVS